MSRWKYLYGPPNRGPQYKLRYHDYNTRLKAGVCLPVEAGFRKALRSGATSRVLTVPPPSSVLSQQRSVIRFIADRLIGHSNKSRSGLHNLTIHHGLRPWSPIYSPLQCLFQSFEVLPHIPFYIFRGASLLLYSTKNSPQLNGHFT